MTKTVIQQQLLPPIVRPTFDSTMERYKRNIFQNLNCHRVGIVQSFNLTNQTAVIQMVDNYQIPTFTGNETTEYSPLINCPIIILKGKKGGLTTSISIGDECLIFYNDVNLDNWQVNGGIQQPADSRSHDMTDAIAIVGLHSYINSIADYNNAATEMDYIDNSGIRQGLISIDTKIGISNATQNLKTLVDNLITIIKNLKTVNGSDQYPIDSITAADLDVIETNFNNLLK